MMKAFWSAAAGVLLGAFPIHAGPGARPNTSGAPIPTDLPSQEIVTRAEVKAIGMIAFLGVPSAPLLPYVGDGFELRPCKGAPNGKADVFLFLSEERLLDVPQAPRSYRFASILTCADPPPELRHPNPSGEFPWYRLFVAIDSKERIELTRPHGAHAELAEIDLSYRDGFHFSFAARVKDGSHIATAQFDSAGVEPPGSPFTCKPRQSRGRAMMAAGRLVSGMDWIKQEATCSTKFELAYGPGSLLHRFVGDARPTSAIVGVVQKANYSIKRFR